MPKYERDSSRSLSPRPLNKRPGDELQNHHERSSQPHGHRRRRSRSLGRDERLKKRRSMSPESDREGEHRRQHGRYRERSPNNSNHRRRRRSRSRSRSDSRSPKVLTRSKAPLPPQDSAFRKEQGTEAPVIDKQKPNFGTTGRLAAASNTVQTAGQTIVLKYHEPAEARKPPSREAWRMYVFKDDEIVDTVQLYEQSCWLFGREMAVTDIPIEHPSCSKQHAVIQFRYVERRNEFGDKIGKVKPYALDLESSNGTFVNGERIPDAKYVELRDKDMVKFGHSRREYVVQLPKS